MKTNRTVQLILAVVVGVVVQQAVAHYDEWLPHSWQPYAASDGTFSIEFPAKPATDTISAPGADGSSVTFQTITAQPTQSTAYTVTYVDRQGDPGESPQQVLDASRDGALKKIQGTRITQKNMTVQGYPALDVQAHARQDSFLDLLLILVKNRLFMLMAIAPNQDQEPKTVQRFFDSFKIHAQP
jgi:hypothetical protein